MILAAAAAAVYAFRGSSRKPDNRLIVSGNIELTEVNIAFKTAGRLIERTVDEGDAVKKGQVIARLDRDQLLAQRESVAAGLLSAETQLAQSQTSVEFERQNMAADIEGRQADLGSTEARLTELKNGARPQEKAQAHAMVESAAIRIRSRQDAIGTAPSRCYKNDDISTAQFDQFRNRFEAADAALKNAKEAEALVLAGPRTEEIEAQQRPGAARARRRQNGAGQRLGAQAPRAGLLTRRADIARSRANHRAHRFATFRHHRRRAVDGVVLVKSAEVGEVLAAGTTVVTIGDIDHPWLRGYINETDLGQVKLGTEGERNHRLVQRQGLQRQGHLHLLGSRVHAQADPDQKSA